MPLRWIDRVRFPVIRGSGFAARRFNGDYLGQSEVDMAVAPSDCGSGWSERNRVWIVLGVDRGFGAVRNAHPAFVTGDFEAALERCAIDGSVPAQHGSLEGVARTFLDIPCGNRIELFKEMPRA